MRISGIASDALSQIRTRACWQEGKLLEIEEVYGIFHVLVSDGFFFVLSRARGTACSFNFQMTSVITLPLNRCRLSYKVSWI